MKYDNMKSMQLSLNKDLIAKEICVDGDKVSIQKIKENKNANQ